MLHINFTVGETVALKITKFKNSDDDQQKYTYTNWHYIRTHVHSHVHLVRPYYYHHSALSTQLDFWAFIYFLVP